MSSNIRIERTCQVCGKLFIAKTTVTKNCSDSCAKKAYKLRKKQEAIEKSNQEEAYKREEKQFGHLNEIQDKQFLNINEASELIGASKWTLARLIRTNQLKASKIGNKLIIKRTELDKLFN